MDGDMQIRREIIAVDLTMRQVVFVACSGSKPALKAEKERHVNISAACRTKDIYRIGRYHSSVSGLHVFKSALRARNARLLLAEDRYEGDGKWKVCINSLSFA